MPAAARYDARHRMSSAPIFRSLLKHWRSARGMSQLDLASAAEVSARHLSFLETGRAQPSREMILKLAGTLGLGLRDQNTLLDAAGFAPAYGETTQGRPFDAAIEAAIARMLAQQEPYPLVVTNHRYDVLRMNLGAARTLMRFMAKPAAIGARMNVLESVFDPDLVRPFIENWAWVARHLLTRVQREALGRPGDDALRELVHSLCSYPGVAGEWFMPDLSLSMTPVLPVTMARDGLRLSFLTTTTVFNAPQDVGLEELRLESYFPLDTATERACAALAAG
jgi:transcriptional regulator with XRE-family HTH domain